MWISIGRAAITLGVGTGIGVGIKGGNIYEVVGWTVVSAGLVRALGSGVFWRGAWGGVRLAGPPLWMVAKDIAYVARGTAVLILETPTAAAVGRGAVAGAGLVAAVGVGYTAGAVTGTVIVSQAEKKGIVYEGATEDVLEFYMGEGHYWEQGTNPTPGYFNIPGNVSLIADHVKHGHYFGH
jgi:hypothetical protein